MATDYTIGDRAYWVEKARKRGWYISKLIDENKVLEARVARLEAQNKALKLRVRT